MIQAIDIEKRYERATVLNGIGITLTPGSIYGLIGPNGSGKTTLLKVLSGRYRPDQGQVRYLSSKETEAGAGFDLSTSVHHNPLVREKIAYVPDSLSLYPGFSARQTIDFYRQMYKDTWQEEELPELLERLQIPLEQRVGRLSKGTKMRLALVVAFACGAEYILLDEPTAGLDPLVRREVLRYLVDQAAKRQSAILIASHTLSEIEQICDRIGLLRKGQLRVQADLETLKRDYKKVQVAFAGDLPPALAHSWEKGSYRKYGRVYEKVIEGSWEDFKQEMERFHPLLLTPMDMTLEEIFVCLMKKEGMADETIFLD